MGKLINRKVRVTIKSNDIFRVPLMWVMPDSKVDLFVEKQQVGNKYGEGGSGDGEMVELIEDLGSLVGMDEGNIKV